MMYRPTFRQRYRPCWMRTMLFRFLLWLIGGGEIMVTVYVTLIVRGYKTFAQVPDLLKDAVRAELEALELGYLAA
jgi:hypothetical protein